MPHQIEAFERIFANYVDRDGNPLKRRERQEQAMSLIADKTELRQPSGRGVVIVQAPTGVGKSVVAMATCAQAGQGIIATATNALAAQYIQDAPAFAAAAGFTYARVMGRSHYVCADSKAARAAGVPSFDEIVQEVTEEGLEGDAADDAWSEKMNVRTAWLDDLLQRQVSKSLDRAVRFEWEALKLSADFGCPSRKGGCSSVSASGSSADCGAIRARAYAQSVNVILTNFHALYFSDAYPAAKILPQARTIVIDEAHHFPDVISEVSGFLITPLTGSRHALLVKDKETRAELQGWIQSCVDKAKYTGEGQFDTEGAVPFLKMPDSVKEFLSRMEDADSEEESDDEDNVLEKLASFKAGAFWKKHNGHNPDSTWRAWTTRSWDAKRKVFVPSNEIHVRQIDAAERFIPRLGLNKRVVMMSGTLGESFPERVGHPDLPVHDLGQEFKWARVEGGVSAHSGVKWHGSVSLKRSAHLPRVAELADRIDRGGHRGALVLTTAHSDVSLLLDLLPDVLRGRQIFAQPPGKEVSADLVKRQYVEHIQRGGHGVLIGTDTYATGTDLPGELCTLVALWTCPMKSQDGYFDKQLDERYADHLLQKHRAKISQAVGRLLRSPDDEGEIFICDNRGSKHLLRIENYPSSTDAHLLDINWTINPQG